MPTENQTTEQPEPQVTCCDCDESYSSDDMENNPDGELVCNNCLLVRQLW